MKRPAPILCALIAIPMAFTGCETGGGNALAGAAAGAGIGGLLHGRGEDALVGAAIGAGAGYLIGRVARNERQARERRYDEESGYRGREYSRDLPYARPANRYGFVTSPFPPFNLIDVRGIPHGATVIDPSCNRRFLNP